jgi:hypothetical protein
LLRVIRSADVSLVGPADVLAGQVEQPASGLATDVHPLHEQAVAHVAIALESRRVAIERRAAHAKIGEPDPPGVGFLFSGGCGRRRRRLWLGWFRRRNLAGLLRRLRPCGRLPCRQQR